MTYIANTADDTREMLAAIGVESIDDLFADIPADARCEHPVGPGAALSELETLTLMERRAIHNRPATCYHAFIGGGAYEHFIPAAVGALAQRGEILTAYTPYQPEASQGTLQVIYEFQSMICGLTGMEVANASMYDGASALAEAVIMATHIKGRRQVVIPATLNPHYRDVIKGYVEHHDLELIEWGGDAARDGAVLAAAAWPAAATEAAAVVIQTPNVYGYVEDGAALAAAAHAHGALAIACVNPMSLAVLVPPGEWGADIVVGEAQPIGLPLNFGGPYAGFFATRREHIRRMPGRIVGRTTDHEGHGGYVLTLQTREQHIRREKATSNICTNQGLCASMVTMWLAMIGKQGFAHLGALNMARAEALANELTRIPGVKLLDGGAYFNEFTLALPLPAEEFYTRLRERDVLPGIPAVRLGLSRGDLLIVCATETKTDEDIALYVAAAKAALR
jgi:glycine dehydrogenase subunit 1